MKKIKNRILTSLMFLGCIGSGLAEGVKHKDTQKTGAVAPTDKQTKDSAKLDKTKYINEVNQSNSPNKERLISYINKTNNIKYIERAIASAKKKQEKEAKKVEAGSTNKNKKRIAKLKKRLKDRITKLPQDNLKYNEYKNMNVDTLTTIKHVENALADLNKILGKKGDKIKQQGTSKQKSDSPNTAPSQQVQIAPTLEINTAPQTNNSNIPLLTGMVSTLMPKIASVATELAPATMNALSQVGQNPQLAQEQQPATGNTQGNEAADTLNQKANELRQQAAALEETAKSLIKQTT